MRRTTIARLALLTLAGSSLITSSSPASWLVIPNPKASTRMEVFDGQKSILNINLAGWGPRWRWVGIKATERRPGNLLALDVPFVVDPDPAKAIVIATDVRQAGPRELTFRYVVKSRADVPITILAAALTLDDGLRGRLVLAHADGSRTTVDLPAGPRPVPKPVVSAKLLVGGAGRDGIGMTFGTRLARWSSTPACGCCSPKAWSAGARGPSS
jgi:hypothetical protein